MVRSYVSDITCKLRSRYCVHTLWMRSTSRIHFVQASRHVWDDETKPRSRSLIKPFCARRQTYEEHRSDEYCRCSSGISQPRLQDLTNAFSRLNVDPSLLHSGLHTSTEKVAKRASLNRLRWAVHDKEKFSELVDNLSYFVSRLREIFPVKTQVLNTRFHPRTYSNVLITGLGITHLRCIPRIWLLLKAQRRSGGSRLLPKVVTQSWLRLPSLAVTI